MRPSFVSAPIDDWSTWKTWRFELQNFRLADLDPNARNLQLMQAVILAIETDWSQWSPGLTALVDAFFGFVGLPTSDTYIYHIEHAIFINKFN